MDYLNHNRQQHPIEKANFLSKILFLYVAPLFLKGYKKDLEDGDIYKVPSCHESKKLGDIMEVEWKLQTISGKKSVLGLLWKCFGLKYFSIGLISLVIKTIIIVVQPFALGKFISYYSPTQTTVTFNQALNYAALTIILTLIDHLSFNNLHLLEIETGIKARTAVCSLIYRKTLKLHLNSYQDCSNGKLLTSITKDVETFNDFVTFVNEMWTGIIKSLVATIVLYRAIGEFSLLPAVIFVLILPIQSILVIYCTKTRLAVCQQTDKRLQTIKEALSSMKIIKMYGIETFYQKKIDGARLNELNKTLRLFVIKTVILLVGEITRHIGFFSMLLSYLYFGNNVTAELFFFMLRLYQHIALTFSISFPKGINAIAEFYAATKRIGFILNQNEFTERNNITKHPSEIQLEHALIVVGTKYILKDINLKLQSGLTVLIGPTGSGKSTLLRSIAQIHPITTGSLKVSGTVSYAAQEAWLFPSTIRQNILFGEQFDRVRYNEVIRVCALEHDLQRLPNGDETIVEDDGRNFSGGQRARINLARAIYRRADIYLLDSCLSALDAQVADFIFKQCILKFLTGKLVILVDYKQICDYNTIQLKNGTVVNHGILQNNHVYEDKEEAIIASGTIEDEFEETNELTKLLKNSNFDTIYKEKHKSGQVAFSVYYKFMKFGGGAVFFLFVLLTFLFAQILESYEDVSVSQWIDLQEKIIDIGAKNDTNNDLELIVEEAHRKFTINVILKICVTTSSLVRALVLFIFTVQVSKNIHKKMVRKVLNATTGFFDCNFIGTIMNRFSKDINMIDDIVPMAWYNVLMTVLLLMSTVIVIVILDWILFVVVIVFCIILAIIRWIFLKTARHLKRLDASTRSPVVGYLNATLKGLPIIQTTQINHILTGEFDRHQDLYTSTTFTLQATIRAFSLLVQTICLVFVIIVISSLLAFEHNMMAGRVGLIISQCFLLTEKLESGIRSWIEIENQMTSVERAIEYTDLQQETQNGLRLEKWTNDGSILYRNVSLNYKDKNQKILKNVSFNIRPNEKVAIVGRTGAGKSSLISTIFRLYDIDGSIAIDNIDIKTLAIELLRSRISIIPQQPLIFTGTVRENIDPLQLFNDEDIWHTLSSVHLKPLIDDLNAELDDCKNYLSTGQKQLICIARALIRRNKIVILDEATANIDHETADIIQNVLKENFKNCTMLMITHNLQTALQCDRILVIDAGEIAQIGTPNDLLNDKNGLFLKLFSRQNPSHNVII